MDGDSGPGAPVGDPRELTAWIEGGSKPAGRWRIGTEHEKFVFAADRPERARYDGPSGIRAVLENLARRGWDAVEEDGSPVGLRRGGQSITLEPGGQFELSGAPLETLHQTCDETTTHLGEVRAVGAELGVRFVGIGADPVTPLDGIPFMPKGRYRIMRAYMPTRGSLGHEMMTNTCTVQVNLDFADERDMVRKFRTALALQPVAAALFANSPFRAGGEAGFLSWRNHVWSDTDPDRCGAPAFVFEDGMGFERYADYALDVPMYFVLRNGRYVDVAGQSFRRFLEGGLDALPGERPTLDDWESHLTTVFTEVRLKRFLEMRGADGGPWRRLCALPALWTGILYDASALAEAEAMAGEWDAADREGLFRDVPRLGLRARVRGRPVRDVARDLLRMAREGLARRRRLDGAGRDETGFLDVLDGIAESGRTPAEDLLEARRARWEGRIEPVLDEEAY